MGVSLPSGSRTRRPARSAAPGAPLGVGRGGLSQLPGGGPAPASAHQPTWPAGLLPLGSRSISSSSSPSSISSGLACWASWASSSREASLLGKAGGRGRGPHCSAGPSSPPTSPPLPSCRAGRLPARLHRPALTSQTGSCSGPARAGPAQPQLPAARPAVPAVSCRPCRSAQGPGRTLRGGSVGVRCLGQAVLNHGLRCLPRSECCWASPDLGLRPWPSRSSQPEAGEAETLMLPDPGDHHWATAAHQCPWRCPSP